jgi:exopolysaccharide production protein ExoQ
MPPGPGRVALVGLCLLVLTNGPLFLVARRVLEGVGTWEDPVVRHPLVATSLVAVGLVVLDHQRVSGRRLARPSLVAAASITAYSVLAVLSTHWSLAPEVTLWRAVTYLGLPFLAWVIADLGPTGWRRAMTFVVAVAVVGSLLMVLTSSAIALDVNDDWRGIYTNRNSLAPLAALGLIIGAGTIALGGRMRRYLGATLVLVSLVVLLGTGSRTAWLALFVAMGIGSSIVAAPHLLARFGGRVTVLALGSAGGAGLVALVVALSRLWGESTFEQRRTIWSLVWDHIGDRPVHGHGFFAVWDVPEFTAEHFLLERGSAHSSALEVWLGLGLVGLIPFAVIVVLAVSGTVREAWRRPSAESWIWLVAILFLLIENITESFVLWFSYNWVLLMAAALRFGMSETRSGVPRAMAPASEAVRRTSSTPAGASSP